MKSSAIFLALISLIEAWQPLKIRKLPNSVSLMARKGGENEIAELTALWGTDQKPPSAADESLAPKSGLERLYERFARDVLLMVDYDVGDDAFTFADMDDVYDFNALSASRQHSETLFTLIKSDVQNRKDDEDELRLVQKKRFPSSYRLAIQFLSDILQAVKAHPEFSELSNIIKFIPRKEGLRLSTRSLPDSMSVREIVEIKRKIERSLSLVMLLCITYRAVKTNERTKADFIYFVKGVAERVPVQDKHFAMLLLCRGILQPSYYSEEERRNGDTGFLDKVDAQSVTRAPLTSLKESFLQGMKDAGVGQPTITSKLLFPFAAAALRCYHVVADNEPFTEANARGNDDLFAASDPSSSSSSASAAPVAADMYSKDEGRLCEMLRDCKDIDDLARQHNGLEDSGAELLSSLRRWLVDLTAVHFINDEDLQMRAETLPEELRRNTVAMELLATSGAFVLGRRRQRVNYAAHLASLGKKVQVTLSAFEEWRQYDADAVSPGGGKGRGGGGSINGGDDGTVDLSDGSEGTFGWSPLGHGPGEDDDIDRLSPSLAAAGRSTRRGARSAVYDAVQGAELASPDKQASLCHPLANVKKFMTIVNAVEYSLPYGHPLSRQVSRHFELAILGEEGPVSGGTGGGGDPRARALLEETVEAKLVKMNRRLRCLHSQQRQARAQTEGEEEEEEGAGAGTGGQEQGQDLWADSGGQGRGSTTLRGSGAADRVTFAYAHAYAGRGRGPGARKGGEGASADEGEGEEEDGGFWSGLLSLGRGRGRRRGEGEGEDSGQVANDVTTGQALDQYLLRALAPMLDLDSSALATNSDVSAELSYIFSRWRQPHLLFDYYRIHSSGTTGGVLGLYRRFLRALLGVSAETTDQLRYCDPANRAHLSRFPPEIITQWVGGRTPGGDLLPGYNDPQTLFMLGEDANSCMMIKPRQRSTSRGLLSFLTHGNVRVVGSKDSAGRLRTRSVVKLLVDEATRRPVLYAETPLHNGRGDRLQAVLEVYDQVAELGRLLGLAVVYAQPPPDEQNYARRRYELDAVSMGPAYFEVPSTPGLVEGSEHEDGNEGDDLPVRLRREHFCKLVDYTKLAPWVWVDGVKHPLSGRYLDRMTPVLLRREEAELLEAEDDDSSHDDAQQQQEEGGVEGRMGEAEAEAGRGTPRYYANGFRLPHTLEALFAQDPTDDVFLPDYTCGEGKARVALDGACEGWTSPLQQGARPEGNGKGRVEGSPSSSSSLGGKRRRKQPIQKSQQAMLAQRQQRINDMTGRAERVEQERERAEQERRRGSEEREQRAVGRGEVELDEVYAPEDSQKEPEPEPEPEKEPEPEEEDDTEDLW